MLAASLYLLSTFLRPFTLPIQVQTLTSTDWAGYSVATDFNSPKQLVTGVSGSWAVPEVTVSQTDTFSAAWIGIGGQLDRTLIQTGTEHDSINGTVEYSAWYELLPDFSIGINMNISPGDKIAASIELLNSATNEWTITIADTTNGQSFQQNVQYNSPRLSAEWIVERPTIGQDLGTLANFGSVTFTAASAIIQGNTGSITDFSYVQIIMQDRQNRQLTTVSSLSTGGSSFTVTYLNIVSSAQNQLSESLSSNMATQPMSLMISLHSDSKSTRCAHRHT
jgi:hypothetical protein